jgi:tetratricopeptide (TPR) repeat protein
LNARRLFLAALCLSAAACSNGPGSAEAAYRRGLAALEAGEPRTARVELMNAIKADPGDGRIRLAQARVHLLLGDGAAAEAELNRARASGIGLGETHHLMAQALLLQGQAQRALDEAAKAPPAHAAYAARMRGRALLALGDTAGATAAFDAALAVASRDSALWVDIARLRRFTGELGGAIAATDRAVAFDPESVEALSLRGELTRTQYGLSAAIPWFDRALDIDPGHVITLSERATTLGDLGRMKEMLADTRKILSLDPDNRLAYYLQSMLAARAGKFQLARSLYQRTRGAFDAMPAGMLLAGAIELETGSATQAVQRLQRLVDAQPDNAKARRLLATAQWRSGDAAATIATLLPLAERSDAEAYALTLLAKAYEKQGDAAAASIYLARAAVPGGARQALFGGGGGPLPALRAQAETAPGDPGAQAQLIRALLATGLGAEALERARRLEAASPSMPDAYVMVGDALAIEGRQAEAAREYRKAANIAFSEPVAMRLIEALRNSGDPRGARQVLALFLQQNPQSVPARLLAANAYLQAGQWDAAIQHYEQVRHRLGDRDATLLNNLAWAYSETGDYDRAIPMARKAWSLDPRNPATADTLGWLLFKSGEDPARGLALLEQAVRGAPTDADIRAHLGTARRRG